MTEDLDLSRIKIETVYDVAPASLLRFYHTMYADRSVPLDDLWEWLYRPNFLEKGKNPLVIQHNGEVIAHAGMIPFKIDLGDGPSLDATWFIDFAILPQYQRLGLGKILTLSWMEYGDVLVTFCNEKSMGVFRKYGWIEAFDTRMHHYFLNPFNHPKAVERLPSTVRRIGNLFLNPLLRLNYRRLAAATEDLVVEPVNEQTLGHFVSQLRLPSSVAQPLRDQDYVSWRILDSPHRDAYMILSLNDELKMLVKRRDDKPGSRHLDILWVTDTTKSAPLKQLVATVALWCRPQSYDYVRMYVSNAGTSDELARALRPVVRHPRFAFFSKDQAVLDRMHQVRWHWELMDSDFEFTA